MALGTTPLSDADREHSLTPSLTHSLTPFLAPLRALARRHSRVPDDADDLLQDALLEAVRVGRADLTQAVNYSWLTGTLRNLGAMTARGAVRRRLRESRWVLDGAPTAEHTAAPASHEWLTHPAIAALPPALRDVARLALAGHDRREIAWLLRLTDTAMRQRIAALRRKLASSALEVSTVLAAEPPSVRELDLPLGLIRRALLAATSLNTSWSLTMTHRSCPHDPVAPHWQCLFLRRRHRSHRDLLSRRDRPVRRAHA